MKELTDEIKLTINLIQADIDVSARSELQSHLYSLLEMKRDVLQRRLVERPWAEPATYDDLSPYKTVIKPCGQVADEDKPLTVDELRAGGWWCADTSEDCANAFKSKGFQVYNSTDWGTEGPWDCCIVDTVDEVITRSFSGNYTSKKQIHRIANDFYWGEK